MLKINNKEGIIINNEYKIIEKETIIYLHKRSGEIFEAIIDTEDLDKLKQWKYRWIAMWDSHTKAHYVASTEYLGMLSGKSQHKTMLLHRYVTDAKEDEVVDHENHNQLDNRKENLRITKTIKNTKHRKGRNYNNTSGYRNVSRVKNKWYVQLQVDGVGTLLKKFPLDQLEEAGAYAKEMRNKYYGDFQGEN